MVLHENKNLRKSHYDFFPKNTIFNQSFFFNTFNFPMKKNHNLYNLNWQLTHFNFPNFATFTTKAEISIKTPQKEKKAFINSLITTIPKWIQYSVYSKNEISFYIFPKFLVPFLFYLKNHANTQFKMLIDITAVDYPSRTLRFQVVYNILSISYNARLKVKTCIDEVSLLSSVTTLYSSAGWWEREVWDMFGIFFSNHPDLRRILTDYGFQGHPLRKDFPLSGFVEVRYDDSEKRVITEPIEVTQEFRYFDFASPWEQIQKT